jgi:hypothetical protein
VRHLRLPAGVNRLPIPPSGHPQIFRRFLALVRHDVIGDLGTLAQVAQARPLDGRDMDEYVLGATVRLDKTRNPWSR